jgi:hypothetical protein
VLSLKEFNRLEYLELNLNENLLINLPAFSINNNNNNSNNVMNKMILNFAGNKIEKMEEFALSLKDFISRLEILELNLNKNLLTQLPAFFINNNNNNNLINKMILNFEQNKIEKIEEFALSLKDFTRLENLELRLNRNLLTKLPAFSNNNNNNSNMINKMILLYKIRKLRT